MGKIMKMSMNIEEQKKKFLDLLRTAYNAKRARWKADGYASILSSSYMAETLDDYEQENRVKIDEITLIKYGFVGSDFWEIICPSLREEGYIEDFGDPNYIPTEYYKRFLGYEKLGNKLRELNNELPSSYYFAKGLNPELRADNSMLRGEEQLKVRNIEREIEKTEKEYGHLLDLARNSYPFFVVNKDNLLNEDTNNESKLKFDSQNGVLRCGNIKPYSFHRGAKGEAPRLKFFRKLWDERRFIRNGVIKKKGEAFPVRALADQVEISEDKIKEMVKGINRILKQRKFPAEIELKNGVLLIITEK